MYIPVYNVHNDDLTYENLAKKLMRHYEALANNTGHGQQTSLYLLPQADLPSPPAVHCNMLNFTGCSPLYTKNTFCHYLVIKEHLTTCWSIQLHFTVNRHFPIWGTILLYAQCNNICIIFSYIYCGLDEKLSLSIEKKNDPRHYHNLCID